MSARRQEVHRTAWNGPPPAASELVPTIWLASLTPLAWPVPNVAPDSPGSTFGAPHAGQCVGRNEAPEVKNASPTTWQVLLMPNAMATPALPAGRASRVSVAFW